MIHTKLFLAMCFFFDLFQFAKPLLIQFELEWIWEDWTWVENKNHKPSGTNFPKKAFCLSISYNLSSLRAQKRGKLIESDSQRERERESELDRIISRVFTR